MRNQPQIKISRGTSVVGGIISLLFVLSLAVAIGNWMYPGAGFPSWVIAISMGMLVLTGIGLLIIGVIILLVVIAVLRS